MAATLAPSVHTLDDDALRAALRSLSNGSVAWTLVADELREREEAAGELRAEQANERFFEERGYWEARAQEDHEARYADPTSWSVAPW